MSWFSAENLPPPPGVKNAFCSMCRIDAALWRWIKCRRSSAGDTHSFHVTPLKSTLHEPLSQWLECAHGSRSQSSHFVHEKGTSHYSGRQQGVVETSIPWRVLLALSICLVYKTETSTFLTYCSHAIFSGHKELEEIFRSQRGIQFNVNI